MPLNLPTLAEINAERRAVPKYQIPTRLDVKAAKDTDEKRDEQRWRKAVIKRDGKVCRRCKCAVVAQLELAPNRLEVHHVAGRVDKAVKWDVRNGIVLCATDHEKVTRHQVHIVQAASCLYRVGRTNYINASRTVRFEEST